jgi:photosystem II stability/assembly factor-like uncharacterized protein
MRDIRMLMLTRLYRLLLISAFSGLAFGCVTEKTHDLSSVRPSSDNVAKEAVVAPGSISAQGTWTLLTSGVTATFRGVSAVDANVVWVSGSRGTVLRSLDGGATWQNVSPPGLNALDFRDVDAMDAKTAYILSIGNGGASRILKTVDGGATWSETFKNLDADGFFDAMAFWDKDHGIAVSDSSKGLFRIITTADGGGTWTRVDPATLPAALDNEGAFAASGTNIAVWGDRHVWIGTGAAARARVLRSTDRGKTWAIADTPIPGGNSAGIYSIAFKDALHGIVVGGDYAKEDLALDNVAVTDDGGKTWKLAPGGAGGVGGFRSVVTYFPAANGPMLIALGPSGADISHDNGKTWTASPTPVRGLHTFSFARGTSTGFAAGARGQIAKFVR